MNFWTTRRARNCRDDRHIGTRSDGHCLTWTADVMRPGRIVRLVLRTRRLMHQNGIRVDEEVPHRQEGICVLSKPALGSSEEAGLVAQQRMDWNAAQHSAMQSGTSGRTEESRPDYSERVEGDATRSSVESGRVCRDQIISKLLREGHRWRERPHESLRELTIHLHASACL